MTQSLSCWNHLKSILRSQVVVSDWSLWETFEIIFHLQTLSQSDYREKKSYNLNDSIFIMLKTSQKYPEKAMSEKLLRSFSTYKYWVIQNITKVKSHSLNDSIFIMLKTSQKYPEKATIEKLLRSFSTYKYWVNDYTDRWR